MENDPLVPIIPDSGFECKKTIYKLDLWLLVAIRPRGSGESQYREPEHEGHLAFLMFLVFMLNLIL